MSNCRTTTTLFVGLTSLTFLLGCGSGLALPPVSPSGAASSAMEMYDANSDGALDETELVACPALKAELFEYDSNVDRKLDEEEIYQRLETMYERKVGLTWADCQVTLDGKPLEGATVKYVPDPMLGENTTQPAEGVTDSSGIAQLCVAPEYIPEDLRDRKMLQVGLYRVEITHPSLEIPARYNTNTELGFEVHPDRHTEPHGEFDLKSK